MSHDTRFTDPPCYCGDPFCAGCEDAAQEEPEEIFASDTDDFPVDDDLESDYYDSWGL